MPTDALRAPQQQPLGSRLVQLTPSHSRLCRLLANLPFLLDILPCQLYIVRVQPTMSTENPILRIDLESPVPVYEQLSNGIRSELVAGRLRPGDPLPTVRELALDLGVHHNTVAEAYRLLAREGWLDLRRGRGALVIARQQPAPSAEARAEFARRLRELAAKAIAQGVPRSVVGAEMKVLGGELNEGGSK